MTNKDRWINELKSLQGEGDTECNHINADDILCDMLIELGYKDIVDEYNKIFKWYA